MELPRHLRDLYRHWEFHLGSKGSLEVADVFQDPVLFDEISRFVHERMSVWEKKWNGEAPPYTTDPIISSYRFCNIFREFDRQTIEFHTLLNPLRDDFALWLLNMFYCRMVARPETVREVGLLSRTTKENGKLKERLLAHPRPKYGTPYVFPISVIQHSFTPTREEFIATYLPTVMDTVVQEITSWEKFSVVEGVKRVLKIFGFNLHFLWTEVLIDVAYQFPEHIDLFKEFPVGPGALPTFRRINASIEPAHLAKDLGRLTIDAGITYDGVPIRLSAESWEGIGCEFRKYTNLGEGKGRKRVYRI